MKIKTKYLVVILFFMFNFDLSFQKVVKVVEVAEVEKSVSLSSYTTITIFTSRTKKWKLKN